MPAQGLVNKVMGLLMSSRMRQIENFIKNPIETQENILFKNLSIARNTEYGDLYGFKSIGTYEDFKSNLPLVKYEDFEPFIEKARKGEKDVSWKGKIKWFAKSSGTTNAKSKFIPISQESLDECHYAAGKMMFAIYLNNHPDTEIFKNKNLRLGGSSEIYQKYDTLFGDLSAILIDNLPFYAELRNTPNKQISLMSEWETKMKAISNAVITEDIGCLTGVPSWMLVLLNNVLTETGKGKLDEVWPMLEVFFHGGISFKPYEENYRNLTHKKLNFYELYNASEGFFGIQDRSDSKDMLLLLDNGIFYEFIPMEEIDSDNPKVIALEDVEIGKNYAIVITTNGGLWRYIIGDTVKFTSKDPFRIIVSGRTKHYINAFGEELIIENAEEALKRTCAKTGAIIKEFTAAPIYMEGNAKGAHEWIIEFEKMPESIDGFAQLLDETLQELNSDYEAKRYKNITLNPLKLNVAKPNLFFDWMKSRGKLGGQNKVPRLANSREFIDPLLEMNKS
ncbi:GH3 auxin-responsive promoter family protein [Moheibacter stercoris]|uniref:GH3 auxin-responsive promoter n=1 Tax=Moheibacter stercoris TaxID=1628251 RepID=A0ABV2LQB5_9FLAO